MLQLSVHHFFKLNKLDLIKAKLLVFNTVTYKYLKLTD